MHRTPESEAIAEPLGRTMVDPEVVLIPKKGFFIKRLDDLNGRVLGYTRGGLEIQEMKLARNSAIKHFEYKADIQGLEMLKLGRVDCIVTSKEVAFYLMKQERLMPSDFGTPFVLSTKEGNVMFSRNSRSPQLKERIRTAVETLRNKGVFLQIRKNYLGY
jgi:polar amino acid transport system substrate-binding protein